MVWADASIMATKDLSGMQVLTVLSRNLQIQHWSHRQGSEGEVLHWCPANGIGHLYGIGNIDDGIAYRLSADPID